MMKDGNAAELNKKMERQKTAEHDYKIIIEQMQIEAEEYEADAARMSNVLSALNIPANLSNHATLYGQTLQKSCVALDVLTPDEANLMIGISDLHQELETAEEMLECSQKRIAKYNAQLPEILKRKEKWQKELEKLDNEQEAAEQESMRTNKSTLYMSKKKIQYEGEVQRSKQKLVAAGYEDSLSHEALVELGSKVKKMEEQLKPLRLQLSSYKDLPPNMIESQIKLEEKRIEFKKIEKEVTDRLGAISIMQNSVDL